MTNVIKIRLMHSAGVFDWGQRELQWQHVAGSCSERSWGFCLLYIRALKGCMLCASPCSCNSSQICRFQTMFLIVPIFQILWQPTTSDWPQRNELHAMCSSRFEAHFSVCLYWGCFDHFHQTVRDRPPHYRVAIVNQLIVAVTGINRTVNAGVYKLPKRLVSGFFGGGFLACLSQWGQTHAHVQTCVSILHCCWLPAS